MVKVAPPAWNLYGVPYRPGTFEALSTAIFTDKCVSPAEKTKKKSPPRGFKFLLSFAAFSCRISKIPKVYFALDLSCVRPFTPKRVIIAMAASAVVPGIIVSVSGLLEHIS